MKNFFKNKKILVAGGTGLVGVQVLKKLSDFGAKTTSISLDDIKLNLKKVRFIKADLRDYKSCLKHTKNQDIVINLTGVAGSPHITKEKPNSIYSPNILFALNLLEASVFNKVKIFLYTSSYGIYDPRSQMKETDNIWEKKLSKHDLYGGWAKRTGELHVKAILKENSKIIIPIVRPSNIFGPYANFDYKNAMVVPSLISKISNSDEVVKIFGDGMQVRDFVYSKDVAIMMLRIIYKKKSEIFNIGSGLGVTIKNLATKIKKISKSNCSLIYGKKNKSSDKKRILDVNKIKINKIYERTKLDIALKETIDWYSKNKSLYKKRYNSFLEKK